MPGETTSSTLSQAMPTIIALAGHVREYDGVYQRTCERQDRAKGTGLSWNEFRLDQLNAGPISETTTNNDAQTLSGTLQSAHPQLVQILVKVTDRAKETLSPNVVREMGQQAGSAMRRKKDEDYLSLFPGFATTASPGSGNPVSFGHITAAVANATSNVTEGTDDDIYAVLHGFQIKDIQDEILAGVGTYTVPTGMTEDVFRRGFMGSIAGANVYRDNNISINATPDANGAVHARKGVIAVQGMALRTETRRDPSFGGGAEEMFMTDEYDFIERTSAGTQVFCYRIQSDATQPAS